MWKVIGIWFKNVATKGAKLKKLWSMLFTKKGLLFISADVVRCFAR